MKTLKEFVNEARSFRSASDRFKDPWGFRNLVAEKAEELRQRINDIYMSEDNYMDTEVNRQSKKEFDKKLDGIHEAEKLIEKAILIINKHQ